MTFQNFKVLVEHFQGWNIRVFQWNEFKFYDFPELNDTVDLLFHLCFVFGNFAQFFNGLFVIKKSQVPQEVKLKVFIDLKLLLEGVLNFGPMSLIWGDHRFVLEISDHGYEDTPSLDLLTDTEESAAFSIIDFDWLEALSHLLDFIFHFIDVHLSPLELHVIIESVLALFNVFPQLFHPTNFYVNGINNFGTSRSFALNELEHSFIVSELLEPLPELFCVFFSRLNAFETGLNTGVIKVKSLLF